LCEATENIEGPVDRVSSEIPAGNQRSQSGSQWKLSDPMSGCGAAVSQVMDLWRPYLLGKRFQIKTYNQSLKYFLEQHISSPEQQKWVTKLLGYEYEIIYKKGKDNVVAYALS
jgi:hypothetical protein